MNKPILVIVIIVVLLLSFGYFLQNNQEVPGENGETSNEEQESQEEKEETKETQEQATESQEEEIDDLIQCLKDSGVVIYGSSTCPACKQLEDSFGGIDVIKSIYLDCSGLGEPEETKRCQEEMQTNFVPEIQIKGELFRGSRNPESLAEKVSCDL